MLLPWQRGYNDNNNNNNNNNNFIKLLKKAFQLNNIILQSEISKKFCFIFNLNSSNDWIVRNWPVSAKAIGLNFSSNCACAALNWVP